MCHYHPANAFVAIRESPSALPRRLNTTRPHLTLPSNKTPLHTFQTARRRYTYTHTTFATRNTFTHLNTPR